MVLWQLTRVSTTLVLFSPDLATNSLRGTGITPGCLTADAPSVLAAQPEPAYAMPAMDTDAGAVVDWRVWMVRADARPAKAGTSERTCILDGFVVKGRCRKGGGRGEIGFSRPAMATRDPFIAWTTHDEGETGILAASLGTLRRTPANDALQMVEGIIWDSHLSRECGAPGAGRAVGLGIYFPSRCVLAPCLAPWIEDRLLWRVLSLGCFGLIPYITHFTHPLPSLLM